MAKPMPRESEPMKAVRRIALQYPEAQEGISCNKSAFKARNKAFLFMGMDAASYNLMFKLAASLPEAAKLAAKFPGQYAVGGHHWVKATFPHTESPPPGLLERWIGESFRLLAPKPLVALLSARDARPCAAKPKRVKRAMKSAG